jgi:hypothetical protein
MAAGDIRARMAGAASRLQAAIAKWGGRGVPGDFDERLVWIFGSPRSGSTWLLQVLGQHDAVVPINEPLIGWYLGPFISDLPGMDARELDLDNFTMRRVHRDKRFSFFAEEFADVWVPGLARLMCERFHAHAQRYPAKLPLERSYVVIKEPNGSQSADVLMRALPRSRFLFLLRDGRDVVDSEIAANVEDSWVGREFPGSRGVATSARLDFVTQSAKKWLWRTEVVQAAYAAHGGPKHMVRYEDLRADPATHMRGLFTWLEIEIDDAELDVLVEGSSFERLPEEARGADQFFRAASPGLWRENLAADEQAALEDTIGPKLRELGYSA